MSPVLIYEELRFPAELLSAMLLFLLPFSKKKPRFISRAVMGFCFFTLLSLLYFPIFQDKMAPRFLMAQGPWYFFFAVCPVFYAKLCFEIGWCDALFLSISAFATQNIVYVVLHEFLARSLFPGLREHLILYILLSILICALVYAVVYRAFARHLAGYRKRLFQDSGQNALFCEEHDIDLSCAVDDVNLDFIRISDLYAILGNAIDNAIEYVEQFDEPKMRVINFRISHTKQFLSIQVNNPYLGPALPDGQLPKSSKPDDAYHGFGLKSIRYLAEKYHGGMEISTSDHMFTLQIVLPTREDEGC